MQLRRSRLPFQVKSSIFPRPNVASSEGSSKLSTCAPSYIGSNSPNAFGRRLNKTFNGAAPICKCLLCRARTRKPRITPIFNQSPILSSHSLTVAPSGSRSFPVSSEANAPPFINGKFCVPFSIETAYCAPLYKNSVQITLKIMNKTNQAAPVCEP